MINSRYTFFVNIVSALFIFLFTYTAITKLMKIEVFKNVIKTLPVVGNWAALTAWCIILTECLVVLLLLYPPLRLHGLSLSFLLMTIFTGHITFMLLSSSHLPCSCGGVLKELSWKQHLRLNILLWLLALAGLSAEKKIRKAVHPVVTL